MGPVGTRFLKTLQLTVSAGVLVLFVLIYPGGVALAVGLCYVAASLAAARNTPTGVWLAFTFSALAFVLSAWGVYRYLDNGFDYLSGNFAGRAGVYWPAYLFLFVAAGSITVVVLQIRSWRGTLHRRGPVRSA